MQGIIITALAFSIVSCSWVPRTWFTRDKEVNPPTELTPINKTLEIKQLWSHKVGDGADKSGIKLQPLVTAGKVIAADYQGKVMAFDAVDGTEIWKQNLKVKVSGGVGGGEGLVLLGTSEAQLIALDENDGSELWRVAMPSEVLSIPKILAGIVVVRTIDGQLLGLDADSGKRKWGYTTQVPLLSLRGTGSPAVDRGAVFCGFDNGKLTAFLLEDGRVVWDVSISMARGRSELERLVDLDADPVIDEDLLFVATFQGRVAAVAANSGSVIWSRDVSSHRGMNVAHDQVYVTDDEGSIWALARRNGVSMWKQSKLLHRAVTRPTAIDNYVVVADFEGYVHWLSSDDGDFVARVRVDSDGLNGAPVVEYNTVYAYGNSGRLTALQIVGGGE